jgi:hypothetical protein
MSYDVIDIRDRAMINETLIIKSFKRNHHNITFSCVAVHIVDTSLMLLKCRRVFLHVTSNFNDPM